MFCESESGWGEKLALEGGCSAILCEREVSYGSLTKTIVAVAHKLVNKEKGPSEGLFLDVLCSHRDTMHCFSASDFGVWPSTATQTKVKSASK